MNCQQVASQLVAFALGEVSPRTSGRIIAHLRTCPSCVEELASLNATVSLVQQLPGEDVSPEFTRKLALRLTEAGPPALPAARRLWPSAVFAAVGLGTLTLAVLLSWPHQPRPRPRIRHQPAPATASAGARPAPQARALVQQRRRAVAAQAAPAPRGPAPPATPRPTLAARVVRVTGPSPSLRVGASLPEGAIVATSDAEQFELELTSGSRVRLDFDTAVEVDAAAAHQVRLAAGRIWVLAPKSRQPLTVLTPTAHASAQGSVAAVRVDPASGRPGAAPGGLTVVSAIRGRVRIGNAHGEVVARAGDEAEAGAGSAPQVLTGSTLLRGVRLEAPWGQTLYEYWVADSLTRDTAISHLDTGGGLGGGNDLLRAGRLEEAQQAYEEAVARDPADGAAHNNLALARELNGDVLGALHSYQRAVQLAPSSALHRFNLALAYLRIGNLHRAAGHLHAALAADPIFPQAGYQFGRTLALLGDSEGATRQAEALQRNPATAAEGDCLLGDIRWLQGDAAGAEPWLLRAAQADPTSATYQAGLASVEFVQNKMEEARAAAERALVLDPTSVRALNRLGQILLRQGHPEQAEEVLRRAIEVCPESGVLRNNLGLVYYKEGRLAAARAAYREAIALAPESPLGHMGLAMTLEKSGNPQLARREYEIVLRLDPGYQQAAQQCAALLERLGQRRLARDVLTRAQQYDI